MDGGVTADPLDDNEGRRGWHSSTAGPQDLNRRVVIPVVQHGHKHRHPPGQRQRKFPATVKALSDFA